MLFSKHFTQAAAVNVFARCDMRESTRSLFIIMLRANFQQRREQFSGPNGGLDICWIYGLQIASAALLDATQNANFRRST